MASPLGRELSTLLNNELLRTTRPHVVDRTLQLLQALGVDDRHVDFGLRLPPDALQKVDQFLQSSAQTTFAVLNPGAIWPSKMWEMDRFGQVARHLHHELGVSSIVQWSGEREYRLAQDVIKAADRCAILAPETSLLQLAALLFRASLYIGGDTGPTHIAVAVGTPCIGLYGTTQPLQSGAYGPQNILLQRQYHGGTTRQRRHAANDCMRQISVRDVTRACDLLVERIRRPAGQQPAA